MNLKLTALASALFLLALPVYAQETNLNIHSHDIQKASDHAPIGVMGEHLHDKGEWMLSYRYMSMEMDGMMDGDSELTSQEVFAQGFMVTPTDMRTDMHMFGAMYAPSDKLTLMAMGSYIEKEMDHQTMGGARFTTTSEGIGDVKVSALYGIYQGNNHTVILNGGVSLPTGSVTERDKTPASAPNSITLPYPMQIGTGTVDLLPGITYTGRSGKIDWGSQYRAEIRIGDNQEDYNFGDLHQISGWTSYSFADWISSSLRISFRTQDDISGRDPSIGVGMVPTADPGNHGGERIDLSFGVNLVGQEGILRGHRLATEISTPVYQNLNGPQMSGELMVTIGWQKAF